MRSEAVYTEMRVDLDSTGRFDRKIGSPGFLGEAKEALACIFKKHSLDVMNN